MKWLKRLRTFWKEFTKETEPRVCQCHFVGYSSEYQVLGALRKMMRGESVESEEFDTATRSLYSCKHPSSPKCRVRLDDRFEAFPAHTEEKDMS